MTQFLVVFFFLMVICQTSSRNQKPVQASKKRIQDFTKALLLNKFKVGPYYKNKLTKRMLSIKHQDIHNTCANQAKIEIPTTGRLFTISPGF